MGGVWKSGSLKWWVNQSSGSPNSSPKFAGNKLFELGKIISLLQASLFSPRKWESGIR